MILRSTALYQAYLSRVNPGQVMSGQVRSHHNQQDSTNDRDGMALRMIAITRNDKVQNTVVQNTLQQNETIVDKI